jgi:hypothetical protein
VVTCVPARGSVARNSVGSDAIAISRTNHVAATELRERNPQLTEPPIQQLNTGPIEPSAAEAAQEPDR